MVQKETMKVSGNKIADVIHFYHQHLNGIYDKEEIDELAFLAFEKVLGYTKSEFLQRKEEHLNQSDLIIVYDIGKALQTHKPIQYILSEAWFYDLKFFVNEHVLIPRQETEELADLVINELKRVQGYTVNVLDIGTGSGCIPVSIKKNIPSVNMYAVDVSADALEVAKKNAEIHETQIDFRQVDMLSAADIDNIKFDYIISNPPYITKNESNTMAQNVLDFEPHLALFVEDNDPLLFYRRIADFALKNLNESGQLFFEINQKYGTAVKKLLEEKGFDSVEIYKDINGNERIVSCVKD